MQRVNNLDLLYCKVYDRKTRSKVHGFSLVFKERLVNFALSLKSKEHRIVWDNIYIVIDYKDKRKKQYEAEYEVIFMNGKKMSFSLCKMKMKKNSYSPHIKSKRS